MWMICADYFNLMSKTAAMLLEPEVGSSCVVRQAVGKRWW